MVSLEYAGAAKPLVLAMLPVDLAAFVELCLVSALAKDSHCGVFESMFLMLVKPASQVITMGVDTDAIGTNGDHGSVCNGPTYWNQFLTSLQIFAKHQVFPPIVVSNMILSYFQVVLHNVVINIAFLMQN